MENANFGKLTSMHFYGWEKGLKTGMYYLRTKAATDAIKFTIDKEAIAEPTEAVVDTRTPEQIEQDAIAACSIENGEDCEACGS